MRDCAGPPPLHAPRQEPVERCPRQLEEGGGAMEHLVGPVVESHPRLEAGVRRGRRPRADHGGEVRQHRAEHERAVLAAPRGDGRVPQVIHGRQ
jgi:hypothetical protein